MKKRQAQKTETKLLNMNRKFAEAVKETPYLEFIRQKVYKKNFTVDDLTHENKLIYDKIISDDMTELKFLSFVNMLTIMPSEDFFVSIMDKYDLWLYEKPYEIFQEKFGKELVRKSEVA